MSVCVCMCVFKGARDWARRMEVQGGRVQVEGQRDMWLLCRAPAWLCGLRQCLVTPFPIRPRRAAHVLTCRNPPPPPPPTCCQVFADVLRKYLVPSGDYQLQPRTSASSGGGATRQRLSNGAAGSQEGVVAVAAGAVGAAPAGEDEVAPPASKKVN